MTRELPASEPPRPGSGAATSRPPAAHDASGDGVLLDVGSGGALLSLTGRFEGGKDAIFRLHAPSIPALPTHARLRWFRRELGRPPKFLCGLVFVEQGVHTKLWRDWLDAQFASETVAKKA